ncbi:MAG: hypothetical protein H6555_10580 [Lewinellaceae bacterium]|nr:hypothetical protein [Lewinellaceae bacterium]
MPSAERKGQSFFYYFSGVILLTVILAFGLNILSRHYHLNSSMTLVITHGMAMLLWYSLLFGQTWLIRTGSFELHRGLGITSIGLAVVLVISGVLIGISNYRGEGEALTLLGNLAGMFNFVVLYTLGILKRHKADTHKRLMLLAGIAMLSPALVRILRLAELNEFITLPFWLLFMAALPIYDWKKSKRIHPVTWLGTGLILLTLVISMVVGMSSTGKNLVQSLFGNS